MRETFFISRFYGNLSFSLFFSFDVNSASGCPIANRNKLRAMELENVVAEKQQQQQQQHQQQQQQQQRVYVTNIQPSLKIDGVNCPTIGCDGKKQCSSFFC